MNIHLVALYLLAAPVAAVNMQFNKFVNSGRRLDHDDDNGNDDSEYYQDPFGNLSALCQLNTITLLNGGNESLEKLLPTPTPIFSGSNLEALDFSADEDAFESYTNHCDGLGGQPIVMQMYPDEACNDDTYDILNFPQCLGLACDEEDVAKYASFVADGFFQLSDCVVTTDVKSLGGGGDGPQVDDECLDETLVIFKSDVYENFDDVANKTTGEFTGDMQALSVFTARCESMVGRVGQVSADLEGERCEDVDLSSVPICVSRTCSDDGAEAALGLILRATFDECEVVSIKFEDTGSSTSKSTKSSKGSKAPKSIKGNEATKAPKSAKGDKAAKSLKEDKAAKATKSPKGEKS